MSTNSGSAPACEMASVVAMNVCGTVTTTSPGFTPAAISAKRRASVPLLTATARFGVAERGKLFFKLLHHRAADEASGADYLLKNRRQLLLEFDMRRDQIKKRNILRMIHCATPVSI